MFSNFRSFALPDTSSLWIALIMFSAITIAFPDSVLCSPLTTQSISQTLSCIFVSLFAVWWRLWAGAILLNPHLIQNLGTQIFTYLLLILLFFLSSFVIRCFLLHRTAANRFVQFFRFQVHVFTWKSYIRE